ncbi:MAG: protein-glutamate O-methyltransferase CheR [Methylovirgula sp.]|uniref:CheR family methyltransferase n=1 Tax=Methylovirgula sp. TaxID=1978224 RepID=UPI003075F562
MAQPIERTLAKLQSAMNAHRNDLAREPERRVLFEFSGHRDRRHEFVLRLLIAAEERAGIDVSRSNAEKLLLTFQNKSSADLDAYTTRLESLPAVDPEWLRLIESLTVHETYVMRDPHQFAFFSALLPEMIEQASARSYHLRFWSVGCATGEEAYSIAALALDAMVAAGRATATDDGITLSRPWQLEVIGSDISRQALARAPEGVYETGPLSSFRAESVPLLHHFPSTPSREETGRMSRVASETLRRVVRFERFNIMDGEVPAPLFDAVFCRNVLIYFSDRARRHAQDRFDQAVRPGGLLLLGPTDPLAHVDAYETLWAPGAIIYRRRIGDA